MDERLVPIIGVVTFLLAVIGVIVFSRLRKPAVREKTDDELRRDQYLENAIDSGVLGIDETGSYYYRCKICGNRATELMPVSAVSWMDKLPLLNRLHSLAPRYVIAYDKSAGISLCRVHKQLFVKKLEEFHALLRSERAHFNAEQEDKVAQMDGGGLLRIVQVQYEENRKAFIAATETPLPALPHSVPPSSNVIMSVPKKSSGDAS